MVDLGLFNMSNFKDDAIDKANRIVKNAQDKLFAASKEALEKQINQVKNKASEAVSKSIGNLESKLKDGVSNVTAQLPSGITDNIKSPSSSAGVTVGLMSSNKSTKFADPVFQGKSVDAIGTVDVYGIKDNAVKNLAEIPNKAVSKLISIAAKGLSGLTNDLPSILKNKDGSFSLSADGLKDRVKDVLNGSQAALSRLGSSIQNDVSRALNGATNALMDKFEGKIGDTVQRFTTISAPDAKGLFASINELTKKSDLAQFFDTGAEAKLLTGLFDEAIRLRVPEAINVLVENSYGSTENTNSVASNMALKNVTVKAMESGDMDVAKLLAEKLGSNQILAIEPKSAVKLLANFSLATPTPQNQLEDMAAKLKETLGKIDPNWMTSTRGSVEVFNIDAFSTMSGDARRVLETDPVLRDHINIASYFPAQSFTQVITDMYPLCPLSSNFR